VQIRKEALWAGFAMKPDYEAMITVCSLTTWLIYRYMSIVISRNHI